MRARELFPVAGARVSGLDVGTEIPNTESIAASLGERVTLGHIREVPLASFLSKTPADLFYASDDIARSKALAKKIEASNRIDPLIIVFDAEGPYVLEGAHRLGALMILGKRSLPALVVVDLE